MKYLDVIIGNREDQVGYLELGTALQSSTGTTRATATDLGSGLNDLFFLFLVVKAVVLPHSVAVSSFCSVGLK